MQLIEGFFALVLLATYGLSVNATRNHTAHICFSLLLTTLLFGIKHAAITLAGAIVTWLWSRYSFNVFSGTFHKAVVWIGMFCWLTVLHLTRPLKQTVHISGSVMLMTIKYTSTGQRNKITLFEWLGWTFFAPSFFTGPTLTFEEYISWYQSDDDDNWQDRKHEANSALINGLWYIPFVLLGTTVFPVQAVTMFESDSGMLYRILFAWMAMWCMKCRYYLVWNVAEASYIAIGASKHVCHQGQNVDVQKVEKATSVYQVTNNWNKCTAHWLKTQVYLPISQLRTKWWHNNTFFAIIATNLVSASWHGFAPGYFLTFLGAGACTAVGREIHRHVLPVAATKIWSNYAYDICMFAWTTILLITFGLPFQLFGIMDVWQAWKGVYFIGHIWLGVGLLIALFFRLRATTPQNIDDKQK